MRRIIDKLHTSRAIPAAAAATILALTGCATTPKASGEATTAQSTTSGSAEQPSIRFDDLGGGSSIIEVYPGTSDSSADKVHNGTYRNGEVQPVVCHKIGRTIISHPDVGETPRTSSDWYMLGGPMVQFATGTYGNIVPVGAVVPEC
jgi:hypothetical protein